MMRNAARIMLLTLCLGLGLTAVVMAGAEQDFQEAITAARAGDMDKAITVFSRVIDAGAGGDTKNLAATYNLRGVCYEAKNDLQKALADYSKAIEIDPKSSEAMGNRAFLYVKLGDTFKAKADAVAAKRIDRRVKVPNFD
jgi:Flp pilus assembly protein TadD